MAYYHSYKLFGHRCSSSSICLISPKHWNLVQPTTAVDLLAPRVPAPLSSNFTLSLERKAPTADKICSACLEHGHSPSKGRFYRLNLDQKRTYLSTPARFTSLARVFHSSPGRVDRVFQSIDSISLVRGKYTFSEENCLTVNVNDRD